MAYPAAPSQAVLTTRAASLHHGVDDDAPVAGLRQNYEDEDEMDLFLHQTDDEMRRQEDTSVPARQSTPNGPRQYGVYIKEEPVDLSPERSHHELALNPPDAPAGAERKRKRSGSDKIKVSPSATQFSPVSRDQYTHSSDRAGTLPFNLKRNRASVGKASKTNGVPTAAAMPIANGTPRALATDQQVAAVRTGASYQEGQHSQVVEDRNAHDHGGAEKGWDSLGDYDGKEEEDGEETADVLGQEQEGQRPQFLDSEVRRSRQQSASMHTRSIPSSTLWDTGAPTARTPSDMEESEPEYGRVHDHFDASSTAMTPRTDFEFNREETQPVEEDVVQPEAHVQDPMTLTWSDLVSGSHSEVWDDSELVDTWSQAEAEYAIYQEGRKKHRELLQLKAKLRQAKAKAQREARKSEEEKATVAKHKQLSVPSPPAPVSQAESQPEQNAPQPAVHTDPKAQKPPRPEAKTEPATQRPLPQITLQPLPSSLPLTGTGAMGMSHDEIMQNLSYSSFYFGYYRALADVSSQGAKKSPVGPPAPGPTPNSTAVPPPLSMGSAPPSTVPPVPGAPNHAAPGQAMMPYSAYPMAANMAYSGAVPYLPMPYAPGMWPQFMSPMNQQ